MCIPAPHFLLVSQASREKERSEWRFVLKAADGSATLEAADAEPEARGERLELLAVVRGLEALDQPSRVTLVTPSNYVKHGIRYGLDEWGRNGWEWERFGEMAPVKNRDLWQRLDRALKIHRMEGTIFRHDLAHTADGESIDADTITAAGLDLVLGEAPRRRTLRGWFGRLAGSGRRRIAERIERCWLAVAQLGTHLLPCPWLD
jgi:ribonuclease HI